MTRTVRSGKFGKNAYQQLNKSPVSLRTEFLSQDRADTIMFRRLKSLITSSTECLQQKPLRHLKK